MCTPADLAQVPRFKINPELKNIAELETSATIVAMAAAEVPKVTAARLPHRTVSNGSTTMAANTPAAPEAATQMPAPMRGR